jgi:hypothetical protein
MDYALESRDGDVIALQCGKIINPKFYIKVDFLAFAADHRPSVPVLRLDLESEERLCEFTHSLRIKCRYMNGMACTSDGTLKGVKTCPFEDLPASSLPFRRRWEMGNQCGLSSSHQ